MTGDESKNSYDAFGVTFNKQYAGNWSFLASFDASHAKLREIEPRDPNEQLYGPGTFTSAAAGNGGYRHRLPEWSYAVRFSGTYQLPWGILYAATFTGQSGEWYGREVQVRDANGANVIIVVEPQVASLSLGETVGQPDFEAVQDVWHADARRYAGHLQHRKHQRHHGADQSQWRGLLAADGDHRATRRPCQCAIPVLSVVATIPEEPSTRGW